LTPVLHKAKSLKGPLTLTKADPNLVSVVHKGEIFSALLHKRDGDTCHVRVIGFNDRPGPFHIPNQFTRDNVILPTDGMAVMVKKAGSWHPARLVGRENGKYQVRYLYSEDGEEVVPAERIRHLFARNPGEAFPVGLFRRR